MLESGPVILILTVVPATFIGLEIFPDVEVIPTPSNADKIVDGAVAPATRNELGSTPEKAEQASQITQQLLIKRV